MAQPPYQQPPIMNYAQPYPAFAPPPPRRFARGVFGWVLFIGMAVMLFVLLSKNNASGSDISLNELQDQFEKNNVAEVVIDADVLRGRLRAPISIAANSVPVTRFSCSVPTGSSANWSYVQWVMAEAKGAGATVRVENSSGLLMNVFLPLVPWILIFGFIWFFVLRQLRNAKTRPPAPGAPGAEPLRVVVVNNAQPPVAPGYPPVDPEVR